MNEFIDRIINHPDRDKVLIGLGSALLGTGLGYFVGHRKGRRRTEWEMAELNRISHQIATEYGGMDLPEEVVISHPPVVIAADDYEEIVRKEVVMDVEVEVEVDDISEEPSVIAQNVFAGDDDDWNMAAEAATRSEDAPYVLHKDEFFEDEKEYSQYTLTYYAGDNIMVDEDDKVVSNHERVTGELKFGHGSGDEKTVYIRNDRLKAEYEVIRDPGHYAVEVQGFSIEDEAEAQDLKHERSLGKFRD